MIPSNGSFRADLHTHTYFSDGSDAPSILLQRAKELGLSGISITDHDTIEAYAIALSEAKRLGIPLLPGVEFSAHHKKEPVHILGYAFSLKSEALLTFCGKHQERRRERNQKILERLKKLG